METKINRGDYIFYFHPEYGAVPTIVTGTTKKFLRVKAWLPTQKQLVLVSKERCVLQSKWEEEINQ